jgi:hypothetical protein
MQASGNSYRDDTAAGGAADESFEALPLRLRLAAGYEGAIGNPRHRILNLLSRDTGETLLISERRA